MINFRTYLKRINTIMIVTVMATMIKSSMTAAAAVTPKHEYLEEIKLDSVAQCALLVVYQY